MNIKFTDLFYGPLTYSKFRNLHNYKINAKKKITRIDLDVLCNFLQIQQKILSITNTEKLADYGYLDSNIYILLPLPSKDNSLRFLSVKCEQQNILQKKSIDCLEIQAKRNKVRTKIQPEGKS